MITLTMLIIIGTIIYLAWNHFEVLKLFNTFKENRNEFDIKIFDKFVNLENKISNDNKPLIHRIANNEKEINQLRENIDKDVIELNTEIQKIKKIRSVKINPEILDRINIIEAELSKTNQIVATFDNDILEVETKKTGIEICNSNYKKIQKQLNSLMEYDDIYGDILCTKKDYHNSLKINDLANRVDKLENIVSSPAFQSYKIFIDEVENHKSKIRTTKGRVPLNKELIVNMIKDGKLSVDGVYSYSQLQTALMEFLQCKKNSTNSKIQRLTNKGLFKKIYSEMGTLYEVNI